MNTGNHHQANDPQPPLHAELRRSDTPQLAQPRMKSFSLTNCLLAINLVVCAAAVAIAFIAMNIVTDSAPSSGGKPDRHAVVEAARKKACDAVHNPSLEVMLSTDDLEYAENIGIGIVGFLPGTVDPLTPRDVSLAIADIINSIYDFGPLHTNNGLDDKRDFLAIKAAQQRADEVCRRPQDT